MKINKKELMTAIRICSTVRNDSTPLWDSMLFQCLYGEITITGRNSRHILSHRIKAEDESTIQPFLFNGSIITRILKECPDDLITLTRDDDGIMTISFDTSAFSFYMETNKALDYINTLPNYGDGKASMTIPVYFIKDHPKVWENFACTDELREIMQYISIEATEGEMNLVATNAHLLFNLKSEWWGEPQTFLLPSRMVGKLCRFIPKSDLTLRLYEKWGALMFGTTSLLYYLPSGKYPNWRAVIEEKPHSVKFLAMELRSAIRQVHAVTNSSTHQIILDVNEKAGISISAHDFDFDQTGKVRFKRTINEGGDAKIGFNSVLLQQCLDALTGTEITMTYSKPNRSVIFKGNGNKDTMALLMPVMINE